MARTASPQVIEITLVSPSRRVREHIAEMLGGAADIRITHIVSSLRTLTAESPRPRLHLIHVDGDGAGARLPAEFAEHGIPALFLSARYRDVYSLSRQCTGSWGWLPLRCSAANLRLAVRAVHAGLISIHSSAEITGEASENGTAYRERREPGRIRGRDEESFIRLSEREQEILELVSTGRRNGEIARLLEISENTVKFHLSTLYARLGVTNRAEAVREGIRRGLLSV